MSVTFNHAGKIGDLLYSLNFCLELVQHFGVEKFNFHIQTNVEFEKSHVGQTGVMLTTEAAQFIKPLLEAQPYIEQVTVGDQVPNGAIDLNKFRKQLINYYSGDIRDYYYSLTNVSLPREFWKQVLFVEPNVQFKDKILFTLTERYVNCNVDYKQLEQFKDKLVFVGTEAEHKVFCQKYFELKFVKFNSLLELASAIAGAKGYISNQNGLCVVAEGLKVNRGLITADHMIVDGKKQFGPVNVVPLGGLCSTIHNTSKLIDVVKIIEGDKK